MASSELFKTLASTLKWTPDGLIPAIVQDAESGAVLMMAWMDEAALSRTFATGQTHFYSRSRRSAWHKGATSGHVQDVEEVLVDCDADVLLIKARQKGGACHQGYRSCFFRRIDPAGRLETIAIPVFEAEAVYGASPARTHRAANSPESEEAVSARPRAAITLRDPKVLEDSLRCGSRD